MSRTIATASRFQFGNLATPADTATDTDTDTRSTALKLLILFLLVMYSSIGTFFPEAELYRPLAIGAVILTILELSKRGAGFRLSWPEGAMVVTLLSVSAISTFGAIYMRNAADTTLDFAKVVLIYFVIENVVTNNSRLKRVLMTMVIGGLIPALGTIYNYITHNHLVEGDRAAYYGVFRNPNEDAYALVILVPLAAALAWRSGRFIRLFLVGAIGVYLVAIFVTFSRGGLIGLVAVLALLGWKQKSVVIKMSLIGMVVLGVLAAGMFWNRKDDFSNVSKDTTVNQRIATFKAGWEMFLHNPLFGVGPGDSLVAYPLYVPEGAHCGCQTQLVVHNAFMQMLGELGALGFLPFMILIGAALFHAWKLQRVQEPDTQAYAMGLELALWGFVVCGLSGGFAWSWFPYLLIGLIAAARHNTMQTPRNPIPQTSI